MSVTDDSVTDDSEAGIPEITIRPARPEEHDSAADIAVSAFSKLGALVSPEERRGLAERVRATTTDPGPGIVIVAVQGDRVVGSLVYNSSGAGQHPLFPEGWAFIRSVGVDDAFTGRGIGRRLVSACIDRAHAEGAKWLGLYAADANTIAVRLYRDMGFREMRDAPPYWGLTYRVYGLRLSEA